MVHMIKDKVFKPHDTSRVLNLSLLLAATLGLGTTSVVYAELKPMDDTAMSAKTGQINIYNENATSITLSLDARYNLEADKSKICNPSQGEVACNIGTSANNRYVGTGANARKYWMVLKNVTGAVKVPELTMSAQDIDVSAAGNGSRLKPSLAFVVNNDARPADSSVSSTTKWIEIEKFGFESLAIETDSQAEVNADGSLNTNNTPGYRNATLAPQSGNTFDNGKFRGFIGLDMTADIGVNGVVKIFGCNSGSSFRC